LPRGGNKCSNICDNNKFSSATTLRITVLGIMGLFVTLSLKALYHYALPCFIYCFAECSHAESRYAECHGARMRQNSDPKFGLPHRPLDGGHFKQPTDINSGVGTDFPRIK